MKCTLVCYQLKVASIPNNCNNITEILLKVALNTITPLNSKYCDKGAIN
jgi:hypothetical protein